MRIAPVINRYNPTAKNINNSQTNFESKNVMPNIVSHQYTGVASVDLAYISMFDNAIARDLKIMGLI